jgi:hypothetical protein
MALRYFSLFAGIGGNQGMLEESRIQECIDARTGDPRPEASDHPVWLKFLSQLAFVAPPRCYQAFRGMRACGAEFAWKEEKLEFRFPEEFDDEFKKLVRDKYIRPHMNVIRPIINKIEQESFSVGDLFGESSPV